AGQTANILRIAQDSKLITQGLRRSGSRNITGAVLRSEENSVPFLSDFREMAHASRRGIGNKPEAVAVRQRRHRRFRSRGRHCDCSSVVLNEISAHLVYRFVRAKPPGYSAPFDTKPVDSPFD